jgi:hypothetical protein
VPIASARRCLAVLALSAAVLATAACTGDDDGASARSVASAAASASAARDPLLELADTDSPQYADGSAHPVVHRSGTGPAHFTIPRPESATAVKFFVSCSPDSRFRVSIGTWFAGTCSTDFDNSGQLPLGPVGQPVSIDLDLPSGVRYWIVGLAVD